MPATQRRGCCTTTHSSAIAAPVITARRLRWGSARWRSFSRLATPPGTRAVAEVAIIRYHLGQFAAALNDLAACSVPEHAASATALHFAAFLNHIGQDELVAAVAATQQGLAALDDDSDEQRRATWQIVLQRNLAAAYHFQGELAAARAAVTEAVQLAETHNRDEYAYYWSLYEQGLLEQRTGQLDDALAMLQRVREQVKQ